MIFFSRANGTLKQQNDELTRCLMQAQAQVAAMEQGQAPKPMPAPVAAPATPAPAPYAATTQAQAQAVATQAIYESQGFPPAAARAAAQTMNAGCTAAPVASATTAPVQAPAPMPAMQTGATMQAMANFQQAAAAAMQAAMGMNPTAKPMETTAYAAAPQFMTWQYPTQPAYAPAPATVEQAPTATQ